jgi:hypothetical protein
LQSLGTLLDVELDALPLFQVPVAFAADCRVVDKDIRAPLPRDEAIAFGSIEPFDGSICSFRHFIPFTLFVRRKRTQSWKRKSAQTGKSLGADLL